MSGRDFDSSSEEKAARNAALRNQIDDMLDDLRKRTADLQEQRDTAAQQTFETSSDDGMITVRVDATGTVQELRLSDKAFERTTPEKLARAITSVVREASGTAQRQLQAQFAPMADTSQVPDIPDIPGMPSLQGLLNAGPLVTPPDPAAERAQRRSEETTTSRPAPQVQAGPDDWDDDWESNRRGSRR